MNPCEYIWFNNKFIRWEDANTHVLTHALHYGSGVFEGIRAYETAKGPAIFKAKEHYDRLLESCASYDITCEYSVDTFIKSTCELIVKNNLPACYIRPIVYTDYGSIGIIPKDSDYATAIAVWEWGSYLGDDGIKNGIRCIISDIMKTPSQAMPSTAKSCANYANSFLAKKKALSAGYDEAILLNRHGHVSEGPGENIFVIKDNKITTPPVSDDVLKGITRDTAMQLARDCGYEVIEDSILPDQLLTADECFFTGTAAEVTPIREINNQPIGNGGKGPITDRIQTLYFDIVKGKSDKYNHWLTYCKEA
ncbi:MAG: branched-chain amino acid transaminase [Candidatus Marinamargulisbacteria bacterium]